MGVNHLSLIVVIHILGEEDAARLFLTSKVLFSSILFLPFIIRYDILANSQFYCVLVVDVAKLN